MVGKWGRRGWITYSEKLRGGFWGGLEEGGEESVPHHAVEVLTGMAARYNYVLAFTEERWHVIKKCGFCSEEFVEEY